MFVPLAAAPVFGFRFERRGLFFGRELVMELLVADMKELFAAFRKGVGRALKMRWEVGIEFAGGDAWDPPKTFI